MTRLDGLWLIVSGAGLFFGAKQVAATKRRITGRENKWEYGYYLQLRIWSPVMMLLGLAILLGWVKF